ncbi:hypothetical protein ACWF94_03455 [Streptomyces sp. NPDC055078]
MSLTHHRRPARAAGAVLLILAAAGCSGLGRTAVGTVSYETARDRHVQVSNPLVRGCHRLDPDGAVSVHNNTLVDIVMYPTADCSGDQSAYVSTLSSNVIAPRAGRWLSYDTIH